MSGRAFVFGDDVSTDLIAPGRLFHLRSNLPELAEHVLEDADPGFPSKVKPGDFVVAGSNFGCGSSREHAPAIIKLAGVAAVLAKSFARIFYRNAINVGLAAVVCDTSCVKPGDELELDLAAGRACDVTQGLELSFAPMPEAMRAILVDGGLVAHVQKHGDFRLD